MSDFGTLASQITDELHEPGDGTLAKRHIVAALRHYRGYRFGFSEKVATFATVVDQNSYTFTGGASAPPADVMDIDHLRWRPDSNSDWRIIDRWHYVDDLENNDIVANTGDPDRWSIYRRRLYLWPTPSRIVTVEVSYHFDSTRDTATGNEITEASGSTVTNDLFTRGAELLRTRAMYTYSIGRGDRPSVVTPAKLLNTEAERSLMRERDIMDVHGLQARGYF